MKQNQSQSHCLLSKELMQMSKFSRQASTSLRETRYPVSVSLENNIESKSKQQTRSFKTGLLPKFTLISQQKCQIVVGLQILMSAESKRSRLNATAAHSHYGIHKCRAFLSKINLHKPSKQNEQKTMCWL